MFMIIRYGGGRNWMQDVEEARAKGMIVVFGDGGAMCFFRKNRIPK